MVEASKLTAPAPNAAQLAWLQEIGIDKRLLSRFKRNSVVVASPGAAANTASAPVRSAQAAAPVNAAQEFVGTAALLKTVQAGKPAAGIALKPVAQSMQPAGAPSGEVSHDWAALEAHVAACQACSLYTGRSQTVFGSGATDAVDWMVIGEAPGEHDDRLGIPFQGKAGELLHAMLACVGVGPESSVFYTNLIKCRPRGNRTPRPEEIAACLPYLQRQIALLKPRRIVTLGRLAAQALLGEISDFEELRGRSHAFRSETGQMIPVVATYHPASLLSRPQHKANAWRDLNLARAASLM